MTYRGKKVLVCDDEPDICEDITERLKVMGFDRIETAPNGKEAFDACMKTIHHPPRYQAIICDWKMPEMDGIELLKKLREDPFYGKIPFLLVSAIGDQERIVEAASAHVTAYLVKPFSQVDFEKKISRLFTKV